MHAFCFFQRPRPIIPPTAGRGRGSINRTDYPRQKKRLWNGGRLTGSGSAHKAPYAHWSGARRASLWPAAVWHKPREAGDLEPLRSDASLIAAGLVLGQEGLGYSTSDKPCRIPPSESIRDSTPLKNESSPCSYFLKAA